MKQKRIIIIIIIVIVKAKLNKLMKIKKQYETKRNQYNTVHLHGPRQTMDTNTNWIPNNITELKHDIL